MGWDGYPLCCAPVTTRAHAVLIFHKQQHNRWSLDLQMLVAVCLLEHLDLNMRAAVKLRRCCKGNWYSTTPPPPVLLVTVPLCPLYNPGNPRTTSSSTARRQRCRSECGWHGAGTPRCRGEGHDGAEQPVPSLRWAQPTIPATHHIPWCFFDSLCDP